MSVCPGVMHCILLVIAYKDWTYSIWKLHAVWLTHALTLGHMALTAMLYL